MLSFPTSTCVSTFRREFSRHSINHFC